jgi:hypothetical protein
VGQALLIDSSPQVMLYAINLHEYFIYVESVTKTLVVASQAAGILGPKLVTPQPDGFVANDNAPFS